MSMHNVKVRLRRRISADQVSAAAGDSRAQRGHLRQDYATSLGNVLHQGWAII